MRRLSSIILLSLTWYAVQEVRTRIDLRSEGQCVRQVSRRKQGERRADSMCDPWAHIGTYVSSYCRTNIDTYQQAIFETYSCANISSLFLPYIISYRVAIMRGTIFQTCVGLAFFRTFTETFVNS
jgi:hypothetical protein